ncbi:MAG: tetratricopeptide repeat protein [Dactylosporangium sp.]|nr:tetratricopeptide repeat protein [Dactylosporangium sp.]NNJ60168.1 tetratricopeptide repeat protein [Dactylosporangium sp.]
MPDDQLIASLTAAVSAHPEDVPLRRHLAELLIAAGRGPEAVPHLATILARAPEDAGAQVLMRSALTPRRNAPEASQPAERPADQRASGAPGMDWSAYEEELSDVVPPRFVGQQPLRADAERDPVHGDADRMFDIETSRVRLDRTVLVLPPDPPARAAILASNLRERPVAEIDLEKIVTAAEGLSGADLTHLCDTAAEYAMHDSISSGEVRPIRHDDFDRALGEVRPSTGPWFASARNVAMFANDDGRYNDLLAYLNQRHML